MEAGSKTDEANGAKKGPPVLNRKKIIPLKRLLFDENKKAFLRIHQNHCSKKPQSTISDFVLPVPAQADPLTIEGGGIW